MKRTRSLLLLFLGLIAGVCGLTAWSLYGESKQERLNRALIAAVSHDDVESLLSLLNEKHDMRAAVLRNDAKTVVSLLDQGADANCHEAPAQHSSPWQILWDRLRGVKPKPSNTSPPLLLALQYHAVTDVALYPPENLPLIKALLDHKADVNVRDKDALTPLDYAIDSQNDATVHLLLKYGADMKPDRQGNAAPLIEAACAFDDSTNVLSDMLHRGADVNQRDNRGYTALYGAVTTKNVEAVRLLLSYHADVTLRNRHGNAMTPLARAKGVLAAAKWNGYKEGAAKAQQIIDMLKQAGAKK